MLASIWTQPFLGIFVVWQIPLFLALIGLILYWLHIRKKQV